ncbi:MAG: TRAP transporter TatT component family protein [Gammaproteobacteria bacterium]|nr:TRAP transporter TatT component family protein [Gammaproteobacteria bacterium]
MKNMMTIAVAMIAVSGCVSITYTVSEEIAQSLSSGIANQSDIELVKTGIPSYVLLIDGMIAENPDSAELHLAGAKLYSTYASFVYEEPQRARLLSQMAFNYSKKSLCLTDAQWCGIEKLPLGKFSEFLDDVTRDELDIIFTFGVTWAGYIDYHSGDWDAVADLPKVKATMERVLELDNKYEDGGAHLYLGILETVVPPALGGKPDIARSHFERVMEITRGRNLMAKMLYAERYARPLFDRELHDRLLNEVVQQDPVEPDLTLINIIAQKKARQLLESADEFF